MINTAQVEEWTPDMQEELAALLAEDSGVYDQDYLEAQDPTPRKPAPVAEFDDFDDLEQLLAETLAVRTDRTEVKEARKRLQRDQLTVEKRAELQAIVARWELNHDWLPVSMDYIFKVHKCSCGASHYQYVGEFQRQEHRRDLSQRWVQEVKSIRGTFPRAVKEEVEFVSICIKCVAWVMATEQNTVVNTTALLHSHEIKQPKGEQNGTSEEQ